MHCGQHVGRSCLMNCFMVQGECNNVLKKCHSSSWPGLKLNLYSTTLLISFVLAIKPNANVHVTQIVLPIFYMLCFLILDEKHLGFFFMFLEKRL